jgi:prepilin peptidase CpaA
VSPLLMLSTLLLFAFSLIAALTDVARHKIYNWTVYPGILAALCINACESGGIGLEESLKGFFVCGLIMLFCFVCFPLGGGDVKLIAMLGAFLGLRPGLEAMLWTFVLGSVMGIGLLIWRVGAGRLIFRFGQQAWWLLRYRVWMPLAQVEREHLKARLFLAPAAFVALLVMKFSLLEHWGLS